MAANVRPAAGAPPHGLYFALTYRTDPSGLQRHWGAAKLDPRVTSPKIAVPRPDSPAISPVKPPPKKSAPVSNGRTAVRGGSDPYKSSGTRYGRHRIPKTPLRHVCHPRQMIADISANSAQDQGPLWQPRRKRRPAIIHQGKANIHPARRPRCGHNQGPLIHRTASKHQPWAWPRKNRGPASGCNPRPLKETSPASHRGHRQTRAGRKRAAASLTTSSRRGRPRSAVAIGPSSPPLKATQWPSAPPYQESVPPSGTAAASTLPSPAETRSIRSPKALCQPRNRARSRALAPPHPHSPNSRPFHSAIFSVVHGLDEKCPPSAPDNRRRARLKLWPANRADMGHLAR